MTQKEKRLRSDLKQELEEEGSRCSLLVKQHRFNEQCCIRCCQPFSFLLNPRRACLDCTYNVCKACCSYSQQERGYICTACHKTSQERTVISLRSSEHLHVKEHAGHERADSALEIKGGLYRVGSKRRDADHMLVLCPHVGSHMGYVCS
ncbi:hypothetical protein MHYP_G00290250 [Metynnis hypsauchen]